MKNNKIVNPQLSHRNLLAHLNNTVLFSLIIKKYLMIKLMARRVVFLSCKLQANVKKAETQKITPVAIKSFYDLKVEALEGAPMIFSS